MKFNGRRIETIHQLTIDQNILPLHWLRALDPPTKPALTPAAYDLSAVGHRRPGHPAGAYSSS